MDIFNDILIADQTVQLEKVKGKGGWTFVRLEVLKDVKGNHFGWKKVRGFIDDYELEKATLMPMGKGKPFFFPVKSEIRKKINKQEGDWVKLVLYSADKEIAVTDDDFMICLQEEPEVLKNFNAFPETERKRYREWISSAQKEDQKIERMAEAITRILEGKHMWK